MHIWRYNEERSVYKHCGGDLLSFIKEIYREGHKFMMDNDQKHSSGYTADCMRDNSVNW